MSELAAKIIRYFGRNNLHWVDRSYVIDWIFVGLLWYLSYFVSNTAVFERQFKLKDPMISYPHQENQVSGWLNNVVALFVPILLIAISGTIRRSLVEVHHGVISVSAARGLARLVTEFLKHKVGRLRPDFLARCKWDEVRKVCTGKLDKIRDGRQSFPSGHSSAAFAGMTFLSLWLASQTGAWAFHSPRPAASWTSSRMASFVWTLIPLCWATFVAATRIEDYRHHKEDVIVGSLIGIISGTVCFAIFWRHPFSARNSGPQSSNQARILYTNGDDGRPNNMDFELTNVEDEVDV